MFVCVRVYNCVYYEPIELYVIIFSSVSTKAQTIGLQFGLINVLGLGANNLDNLSTRRRYLFFSAVLFNYIR